MITQNSTQHLHFAVLAVDVILFTFRDGKLLARLVAVNRPPAFPEGSKGFPGGLIKPEETAEETAARIIKEKAGVSAKKIYCEQLYTFSQINRDPRGRVVAVSYIAYVPWEKLTTDEQKDTENSWWQAIDDVFGLAYDHDEMFQVAIRRLQSRISYTTVISRLLPAKFTLGEMERAYEQILKTKQDKRNFRKKVLKLNILQELEKKQKGEPYRPAKLYKFKSDSIVEIEII